MKVAKVGLSGSSVFACLVYKGSTGSSSTTASTSSSVDEGSNGGCSTSVGI